MRKNFLDTVVFGIIIRRPYTHESLDTFKNKSKKEMQIIWGIEKSYVTIKVETLPDKNKNNISSFQ